MTTNALVIGRFQIPTRAHFELFQQALQQADRLIIGIGSSNVGRTLRNPFSYEQRAMMIQNSGIPALDDAFKASRISFIPLEDSPYSDQWWLEQVQRKVAWHTSSDSVKLVGCNKDESSYYLEMFPQWPLIEIEKIGEYNATDCRNAYYEFGPFDQSVENQLSNLTTSGVVKTLQLFPKFVHDTLQQRFFYVREYQAKWGKGPFDSADAVVIKKGHILVIKRGKEEFNKDLWALPGGFLEDTDATPQFASLRELTEETGLEAKWYEDRQWLPVSNGVFDKPDRDDRAVIKTHAFCYKLLDEGPMPEVVGKDDAVEAKWVPLADLRADNMYGDHYFIVRKLTAGM